MEARASVRVAPGPRLVELRSESPLTLRWAGGCLYVVGSAFSPLGGDDLRLEVTVEEAATLTVRTVAASIAQPDPSGRPSRLMVTARVGPGGSLSWLPEPAVSTQGSVHTSIAELDLAPGATAVWREEVVLGRHAEPGGVWHSRWTVACGGVPLLAQDTTIGGPDWSSPAIAAGARAAGSLLVPGTLRFSSQGCAAMPLAAGDATLVSALAPDALTLRRHLDTALLHRADDSAGGLIDPRGAPHEISVLPPGKPTSS